MGDAVAISGMGCHIDGQGVGGQGVCRQRLHGTTPVAAHLPNWTLRAPLHPQHISRLAPPLAHPIKAAAPAAHTFISSPPSLTPLTRLRLPPTHF
eukprot:2938181-Prymnesium_polylepis.2